MKISKSVLAISFAIASAFSFANAQTNQNMNNSALPFEYVDMSGFKSFNSNPFGLVYENAITENIPGKINIHPITYTIDGMKIAANVYVPVDYSPEGKFIGIVVAHPNGGVKEQVAGLYAQRLAENGFVTLAFDAAYQGASEGEPRNVDIPSNRIEDIRRAVDILLQYPGIDKDRIGLLGYLWWSRLFCESCSD